MRSYHLRTAGYVAATIAFATISVAWTTTKIQSPFRTPLGTRTVTRKLLTPPPPVVADKGVDEPRTIAAAYGKLPLAFEANQGQTDRDVKFLSRGNGYTLFLTSEEAVLPLSKSRRHLSGRHETRHLRLPSSLGLGLWDPRSGEITSGEASLESDASVYPQYLRMRLVGANPNALVSGMEELPGKSNYLIGNDPKQWRTDVPTYAKVKYQQVYPGVDLVYYGNQGRLEYDFVVSPHADPNSVRLRFDGTEDLSVDTDGSLVLAEKNGNVRFEPPIVYQDLAGKMESVAAHYALLADNTVGFEVGGYDHSKALIIDPVLVYSTYFGANDNGSGIAIAVDSAGDAYVTGRTQSANFPTVAPIQPSYGGGSFDAFVAKINADGSAVVYATYLGGSDYDSGVGIAVDSTGSAYVVGATSSTNFPVVNALQPSFGGGASDAFVAKLNSTGSALVYSTYLGGSGDETFGGALPIGIAIDSAGNTYIAGKTASANFPIANALQPTLRGFTNAFVSKINPSGSALVYSTYLGGTSGEAGDGAYGIAVDGSGNAYVTGIAVSNDFPTVNAIQPTLRGASNAFVSKLNPSGSALLYSTYLGGSASSANMGDGAYAIAVDGAGDAYVTGIANSADFPTVNAIQPVRRGLYSAFVSEINASGSALVYSTYLGGSLGNRAWDIVVDSVGAAYITGDTNSSDFPTVGPFQASFSGNAAFISKIQTNGTSLVYSGTIGSGGGANGLGIAVDSTGSAYATGLIFGTFPMVNAIQTSPAGGYIAKVSPSSVSPLVNLSSGAAAFSGQLITTSSSPQPVTLTNTGNAPLTIFGVTVGGNNAADFSQTNTCGTTVAVGANCSISATFKPTATGSRTASVIIADNSNTGPQAVSLSGNGTDFSLGPVSGVPTSATFTAGQSATLNLQVNPVSGFTGAVNLACTGAPAQSTCTPSASSVNISGASAAPFSVTVTTTARGLLPPGLLRRPWPRTPQVPLPLPYTILVLLCVVAAALKTLELDRAKLIRKWASAVAFAVCLATLVTLSGCGGGGSSGPPPPTGTPAGTYTLTVAGTSQGQNRTVSLTLTVN